VLVAGGQRKNQSTRGNKYAKAYLFPLEILGDAVKKEEAAKIIIKCAQEYEINLNNKNILFVFGSLDHPMFFETTFFPRNFLHLTGAKLPLSKPNSSNFYEKALLKILQPTDFYLAADGTTEKKLSVLPQLIRIHKTAKMVGTYSSSKALLYTEQLAGTTTACLGFVQEDSFYIPNTALKEDIRKITKRPQQRVLAIFRKDIESHCYQELCYRAKGIDVNSISFSAHIKTLLSIDSLESTGKTFSDVKSRALLKATAVHNASNLPANSKTITKPDIEL
jgi:hypothetical protein